MSHISVSLTDEEFVQEVRSAMAGLDDSKIPDDTITQAKTRFVVPLLNDLLDDTLDSDDQDKFDSVAIAWTTEFSFDAWLTYTRLRDREVEAYTDPGSYKESLESRTNQALGILDLVRPPDIPNQVVSVQHDGEKRAINLKDEWVVKTYGTEGSG